MIRKVIISSDDMTARQWSVFLVELNLMKQHWGRFATVKIESPGFEKVVRWGKRKHNDKEEE
jgi:hypothetical protein